MPENPEGAENTGTAGESAKPEPQSVKELPDWAQRLIQETRQEAADYRTRLRDAKDDARNEAKVEFENQISELNGKLSEQEKLLADKDLNYAKLEVALDAGLAGEQAVAFASRLRGTTAEELKADAEEALKIFTPSANSNARATDPSQGRGTEPPKTPDQIMGDFISSRLGK